MIVVIVIVTSLVLVTLGVIVLKNIADPPNNTMKAVLKHSAPKSTTIKLVDHPNTTDSTMKTMSTASAAVHEAQKIQLQIYKELIGHYKKAILVGLADHNLGDSLISVGEFEALKKLEIEVIYYCSSEKCGKFQEAKNVVDAVMEPVVILATGGGNFCIWKSECLLREKMIQTFPDNEVLLFPQSVHFSSMSEMQAHANVMNTHPNITYLFRDRQSYNIIVNSGIFKYRKAVLCPDAATQMGMIQLPTLPTYDIVFLKRRDMES